MTKSKCLIKNMKGKCAKNITILGRRWFQRSYGSTYHTVDVYVDGEHIGTSEEQYGYGDQYITTAFELLQSKGLTPKTHRHIHVGTPNSGYDTDKGSDDDWHNFTMDRREHKNKYVISVSDVERERDL